MENQLEKPIPDLYWVVPDQVLAGEYPGTPTPGGTRTKLQRFLDAGITFFVDLTEPGELKPYRHILEREAQRLGMEVEHRRMAIPDVGTPSPETSPNVRWC
jgi:hypothetical protein